MRSGDYGDTLNGAYGGEGGSLFGLAFWTGFLTLITLGIYRFWAKTRIRRYMWSATAPGGVPFEYTGTGLEKFLGFLIAVVVLAIYLGVFQLLLFFFGLSIFSGGDSAEAIAMQAVAANLTFLALLPLIFFAQYRARRYLLSRTRWRGLRFGAEAEALGYTWRAILWFAVGVLSFGLLLPVTFYKLSKFQWDRTWYGDQRFVQGGHWACLYPAAGHLIFGILLMLAGGVAGGVMEAAGLAIAGLTVGYLWLMFGFVYFGVRSFEILAANRTLADGRIGFRADLSTWQIIGIYIVGSIVIGIVFAVLGGIVGGAMGAIVGFAGLDDPEQVLTNPDGVLAIVIGAAGFMIVLVVTSALALVMIQQPILRHYVSNVTVLGASHLDSIRQREGDELVDAEGFADALDIGAGF